MNTLTCRHCQLPMQIADKDWAQLHGGAIVRMLCQCGRESQAKVIRLLWLRITSVRPVITVRGGGA